MYARIGLAIMPAYLIITTRHQSFRSLFSFYPGIHLSVHLYVCSRSLGLTCLPAHESYFLARKSLAQLTPKKLDFIYNYKQYKPKLAKGA